MRTARRSVLALAVAGTMVCSLPAFAALDEVLPAHGPDVVTTTIAGHTMRVRTRANVKEFANAQGKVFAATWSGQAAPDMRALLGAHFETYQTALRARRRGRHNLLLISTPELTVNVISHARLFFGAAYLTQELPKGVSPDALR